ncbi:unnamed protein product, partial [Ectocarpus sp. 6 AP-2014]
MMSSAAFERSLRGGASSSSSSMVTSSSSSSTSSLRPPKKKSVTWDDDEVLPDDSGGESGVLRNSSIACTNTNNGGVAAAAAAGAGAIHEPQSFDHLRVPAKPSASSTRVVDAAANQHHHGAGSAGGGGGLLASARKRVGAAEQTRGIQMGPLRVRTPAKPKRSRADATPFHAPSFSSVPAPSAGATHNYLRRGGGTAAAAAAAVASSPTNRSSPTSAAGAAARRPRSPSLARSPTAAGAGRSSPPLHPSRIPRAAEPTAARPGASATPGAAGSTRNRSSPRRQRHMSSSQALRNVAGGNGEDDDDAEATFMEDNNGDHGGGAEGDGNGGAAAPVDGPSPMSLLSNTLSAIGLAVGVNSGGKPPRSPRASKGSPRLSISGSGSSPRVSPRSSPRAAARSRTSPFFDTSGSGGGCEGLPRMLEEDEEEDFPLGVARQSLESRLADAAAASSSLAAVAHRASVENMQNNSPATSLSPFTKSSTTVRRTSTSRYNVNGEPSSVVSEEVSEESSVTVTSAACGCHHQHGCAIGAIGGQMPAGENGFSVEVRDRLKELQGRTFETVRIRRVNLTLALAPLEERLQAKERAWESERRELVSRSEANLRSARVAEDRCREVERRKSEMEEERHSLDAELRRLRGEIEQRESKTAASFWQRTVAADREKTRLENALDQAEAKVVTLGKEKSELEAGLMPIQSENSSLKFRLIEAEKEKERKAGDDISNLRMEMQRLQETICSQADRVVAASMSELSPTNDTGGRAMVTAQAETGSAVALSDAALSSEAARIRQQELSSLRTRLEASLERTRVLEKQVEEGEEERRRMHNAILDLTGSVRVYVRARPFLKSDGEQATDQGEAVVRCGADATSIAVLPPDAPNRSISCAFDHVFGGHASQEDVFKEVSSFVQSALDGYKVCLFSYGQTGSGKTHTMTGSGTGMMRGIVPRAVEHILARVGELQDGPWKYGVQASFLEIYNEELRDLLVGHDGSSTKLSIKKSAGGGTEVAGLTKYDIDTDDQDQGLVELGEIMRAAQRSRSVACTAMNAESSRSHSVFTLWLTGVDASTGTTLKGVLHLVDLAGSERLDRSGVGNDAQRLRETQAINKSLSCLADVFSALSAKASHVPFRNSKLTYLMQDCLSGDGKALMFVNLSPTAASANESVCSLRFAN